MLCGNYLILIHYCTQIHIYNEMTLKVFTKGELNPVICFSPANLGQKENTYVILKGRTIYA